MTTHLTRRAVVTATPAAIVAASSMSAWALAEAGDARLFNLERQLAQLNALAAVAERRLSAAKALYESSITDETPEALLMRPGDDLRKMNTCPELRLGQPTGRFWYDVYDDIDRLRENIALLSSDRAREILRSVDPRAEARHERIIEIVECVEQSASLNEARLATWNACGATDAEDEACEAQSRRDEVLVEIARCPASTLAGVHLKVRVALQNFGDALDEDEPETDDLPTGQSLAVSIVKDMARMAAHTGGSNA